MIGRCTTCGYGGHDTTMHAYILCPLVQYAWNDAAFYLDKQDSYPKPQVPPSLQNIKARFLANPSRYTDMQTLKSTSLPPFSH